MINLFQIGEQGGLFAALKNVSANLLVTGRTRLELLGNEIEEEKLRAIRLVLIGQALAFCAGVGLILLIALLTALFWESRLVVLGGSAFLFLGASFVLWRLFQRETTRTEPVFAASLAELQEDIRQLREQMEHEQQSP